jgi:DNA replication and repair protein RecF
LTRARARAAELVVAALLPAFARMAAPGTELEAGFQPGGSDDAAEARARLGEDRRRDRVRRSASFGPHRDELELRLDGRSARRHASQGQQRLLTLSLKAAELDCIRAARGAHPILLLDDVSSELDPDRARSVAGFLAESRSQAFVTTPRPDLLPMPAGAAPRLRAARLDWSVCAGTLSAVQI